MKKNRLIYILAGLVVAVGVVAVLLIAQGGASKGSNASQANRSSENNSKQPTGAGTTTEGTFECLPHKGDGPQTLECAWGLRTDDDEMYELRADDPMLLSSIAMGSRIRVTGMATEESSTTYDIVGAIRVEKVEQNL